MSTENVEVARRLMEAYQRADLDAQLAVIDPDVELVEWPEGPDPRTYRGHGGVTQAYESWSEAWEWLRYEVKEIIDVGERVFVALHMRAKGRGSAIEIDNETFNVFTFRDSMVVKGEFFTDRDRAREAAGLPEEQLADTTSKETR